METNEPKIEDIEAPNDPANDKPVLKSKKFLSFLVGVGVLAALAGVALWRGAPVELVVAVSTPLVTVVMTSILGNAWVDKNVRG